MRNLKLTIEYDGRRYLGWQRLGDSDKTIQGKIEAAIEKALQEKIEIIGSGRTDTGAHARGQVANFKTQTTLPTAEIRQRLNHHLPNDIVIKSVEEAAPRFHARYNCTKKQYSYYIWNDEVPAVFGRHHHFYVSEELSLEKMQEACRKLEGKHDFLGFSALKKSKKSTERIIDAIEIKQHEQGLQIIFQGEGFLYKMVRIMVGTLIEIGLGKKEPKVIDEIFATKKREYAGETAPAQGLFLDWVNYN